MFPPFWQDVGMAVMQCPECPLRFQFSSELEDHLKTDHPDFDAKPRSGDEQALSEARRKRQAREEGR